LCWRRFLSHPINEADTVLLPKGLNALKRIARLTDLKIDGSYLNLDDGFDSRHIRKTRFDAGLIPNIKENQRNRMVPKCGRKRLFNAVIHSLRLRVERTLPGRINPNGCFCVSSSSSGGTPG
jgi:hypothetical protein